MFVENLKLISSLCSSCQRLLQQCIVKENCRTMDHGFSSLPTMYFSCTAAVLKHWTRAV